MKILKKNKSSGITLIALVVTIIVLLLLAGISIQMLTGENGILQRAVEAKKNTEEEQLIEEAKMDIMASQTSKLTGKINEKELKSILSKYGTLSTEEEKIIDKKLTTTDGEYVIPVSRIYNGNISEATIENTEPKYFYGDSIDYDVDIEVSLDDKDQYDWKIFYNDGTNIYIIAEDYVPMNKCIYVTNDTTGRIEDSSKPYSLYWYFDSGNIQNGKDGSADIFGDATHNVATKTLNIANKFLADWKPKVTGTNSASENSNAKMVATLMDTSLWANFATSTKVNGLTSKAGELSAIGGPTLEMWVKSWNQKHGTNSDDKNKLQLYYASNATGYFVGTSPNPSSFDVDEKGTTGYSDTLYYPQTPNEDCYGYWLSSPSMIRGCKYLLYICFGKNNPYSVQQ